MLVLWEELRHSRLAYYIVNDINVLFVINTATKNNKAIVGKAYLNVTDCEWR